jgi:hypothetical protein
MCLGNYIYIVPKLEKLLTIMNSSNQKITPIPAPAPALTPAPALAPSPGNCLDTENVFEITIPME